ncbi:MAG: hypothetical protein N3G22_02880 [Candidatus Micrarchaeota archaeon]|nr:hypothetical protein [Candidatus Micrarchaeota archaeon]
METSIKRSLVSGSIDAPPSVALAHRAIALASLTPDQSVISSVPRSPEIESTVLAAECLGADILIENEIADIFGSEMSEVPKKIDCGECNTTLKLFLPILSLFESEVEFVGRGHVAKVPLEPYVGYLDRLGVSCTCPSGFLPVRTKGPISIDDMVFPARLGSQFYSGLLVALSMRPSDSCIKVEGNFQNPEVVEGTLELLEKAGIQRASEEDLLYFTGFQIPSALNLDVPPSKYLSSFLLLAGAMAGKVKVDGIGSFPQMEELLKEFEVSVKKGEKSLSASVGTRAGASLDAAKISRFLPHALVLASASQEETKISNILLVRGRQNARLRIMVRELSKMGAKIVESGSELAIKGGNLTGAQVNPEGDSTCAMALAVAGLVASGETRIAGSECVQRHYPTFFEDLALSGAIVR